MAENVPEDNTEIFFVCLREDSCLELPATVETYCRTAAREAKRKSAKLLDKVAGMN